MTGHLNLQNQGEPMKKFAMSFAALVLSLLFSIPVASAHRADCVEGTRVWLSVEYKSERNVYHFCHSLPKEAKKDFGRKNLPLLINDYRLTITDGDESYTAEAYLKHEEPPILLPLESTYQVKKDDWKKVEKKE